MDRPIIFSAPMVRALLDGRKSQTRRVLGKTGGRVNIFNPEIAWSDSYVLDPGNAEWRAKYTPYAPGDRLYVREAFRGDVGYDKTPPREWSQWPVTYEADPFEARCGLDTGKLRPPIFMPRWASRITLTVTEVRVQRLQEISEADAMAEGVGIDRTHALDCGPITGAESVFDMTFCADHRDAMRHAWQTLHGAGEWAANPWVVAVTFSTERRNIDAI